MRLSRRVRSPALPLAQTTQGPRRARCGRLARPPRFLVRGGCDRHTPGAAASMPARAGGRRPWPRAGGGCLCGARRRGRSWAWRRAALPHPTPPPLSFAGGTSGLEAWGGLALVNKGKPHGRGRALSAGRLAPGALVAVRASGGGPRAPLRPRPVLLPRYVFCGGIAWGSRSCPRPPPLPPPSGSVRAGPWWPGGARRPARGPRAPAARALGGLSAGVPRQCCPEESFLL